jgi:hypothetical protein
MTTSLTIERQVHFGRRDRGRKELRTGPQATEPALPPGRVPRVARLLALALRFDQLIRTGAVADYAELGRLGHVSRARISQIMNLLLLAPDIVEGLLFLPLTERGRDPIRLQQLQPIALTADWSKQRRLWRKLRESTGVLKAG